MVDRTTSVTSGHFDFRRRFVWSPPLVHCRREEPLRSETYYLAWETNRFHWMYLTREKKTSLSGVHVLSDCEQVINGG